jgi:hypothetical protein
MRWCEQSLLAWALQRCAQHALARQALQVTSSRCQQQLTLSYVAQAITLVCSELLRTLLRASADAACLAADTLVPGHSAAHLFAAGERYCNGSHASNMSIEML